MLCKGLHAISRNVTALLRVGAAAPTSRGEAELEVTSLRLRSQSAQLLGLGPPEPAVRLLPGTASLLTEDSCPCPALHLL